MSDASLRSLRTLSQDMSMLAQARSRRSCTPGVECGVVGSRAETATTASIQAAPLLAWGLASVSTICSNVYLTPPR
jgi:hypothetical protein